MPLSLCDSVYYYNFGWKDYGVASLMTILDMVKVMSFAVQEGKLAVHCHAGLGRTGLQNQIFFFLKLSMQNVPLICDR